MKWSYVAQSSPQFNSSASWSRTLAAICVAQATAIAGFDFTLPFIPLYLQRNLGVHGLGQTALWAGLIGFGPAIPATIFGPMWGRLADRVGYRLMLLRAMACAAFMITLMGFAPSPGVLLALRMIQGGLTGTVFAAQALVASSVPEKETGRAMGLLQMSVYVGATFGPIGGGAVADLWGFRAAFVSAGCLLGLATLVVFAYVHEPARRGIHTIATSGRSRLSVKALLSVPAFAAALALTLLVQLAATAVFPVIPLYVGELLHGAPGVAAHTGWLFALSGISGALGSYSGGRLQRRVGLKPLLLVSVGLCSVLVAPQAFVDSFTSFLALRVAAACAFGALLGAVGTLAAVSSPANAKGAAFGLVGAASSLGFGCGPLLGGAIVALTGIRPLFVFSAGLLAVMPLALIGSTMILPAVLTRLQIAPDLATRLRASREG
jgi:DHA1 family multidrug resistance protein-like MFS transporter